MRSRLGALPSPLRWDTFKSMERDCHRCGAALASPEAFCANCGAPQLRYEAGAEGVNGAVGPGNALHRDIQWKQAVGAAVTFAVPVGVLCSSVVPIVSDGYCLWVVAGAVGAVALYRRRSATRVLPRPVGVRIGAIIGILAAAVAAAFNAGSMLVERYVMHGGEAMDKAYQTIMEQASAATAPMSAAIAHVLGGPPAESRETLQFLLSSDGRAASALMTALMASVGMTVFSMIGGALGTRILSERSPSPRDS
jgi:hypothetical protein